MPERHFLPEGTVTLPTLRLAGGGLTSQAAGIIPKDSQGGSGLYLGGVPGVVLGSLQGHPQGVFEAPTGEGGWQVVKAPGLYSGMNSGNLECHSGGLERYM